MFNGKSILITGGTGSFGKAATRIILESYKPKRLVIFSRDEYKQFEMAQQYPVSRHPSLRYFIGDVRDRERVNRAFTGVDYVIHAAALKHVPIAEYNPFEAIKTNIIGAQNVINAALDRKVKRIIALSTDKAANPINLYGATKLCSDKLFIDGNVFGGREDILFSVVRYGNVMGSRGSVVPFFLKEREKNVLPITDPAMTRFWIALDDGVRFVLSSFSRMIGGELFVPKMPSARIDELARAIGPTCRHEVVGVRPGEKLHEALITRDEARKTLEYDSYYMIKPDFTHFEEKFNAVGGAAVVKDFEYNSFNNPWRVGAEELRSMLLKNGFPL